MKKNADIRSIVSPVPASIVTCGEYDGISNLTTIAWTGNVNSEPPMTYVCIRTERFSHDIVEKSGEFVINLATAKLVKEVDICGMYSGKNCDKWELSHLTKAKASVVKAPIIEECPINIECKVTQIIKLPSHDMFIGEVVAINADDSIFDEYGRLRPENIDLLSFVNKNYCPIKKKINEMGFSIRKRSSGVSRKKSSKFHVRCESEK